MTKHTMKAVLPAAPVSHGRMLDGDKEQVESRTVVALWRGHMLEVVKVRAWMGCSNSASTVYASVWINSKPYLYEGRKDSLYFKETTSGRGSAGGYGYHKTSAAVAAAISDAGVKLYGSEYAHADAPVDFKRQVHFGGCGDSSIDAALLAIARACVGHQARMIIVKG